MSLREIFWQANRMNYCERLLYLQRHRDRYRPRSVVYGELQAEIVRVQLKRLQAENRELRSANG
jgi:hypothetical protein